MVQANSMAAIQFFASVVEIVPIEAVVKFIHTLAKFLKNCVNAVHTSNEKENSQNDDQEAVPEPAAKKQRKSKNQSKKKSLDDSTSSVANDAATINAYKEYTDNVPLLENTVEIVGSMLKGIAKELEDKKNNKLKDVRYYA